MQDLELAKAQALERQRASAEQTSYHIKVSMASCGIAAGAGRTMETIQHMLAGDELPGVDRASIRLTQTGCLGLCALEPIVQVQAANQPLVTYGKVTSEVARRILREHIGKGLVVHEYMVENV
jgi:NADP-reducing hydrogenase subunit HndB